MAKSKPRVLHVDTATEWRGGQVQLLALVRGMEARGWTAQVACPPEGRLWQELAFLGDRRLAIPAGASTRTTWYIRQSDVDLVAAHTSHGHSAATLGGKPLVVHRRVDFEVSGGWKYQRPAAYIAVSKAVADVLTRAGVKNVDVVHDGVAALPAAPAAPDGPEVLAVGARVAHKGHRVLAEAAETLSGVDIGVAGEGPLKPPGLRYLGWRPDVPALLAAADVFVHPSLEEGMGQAVVEAMLAGVPVVVSDAGGLPEVVGDLGLIVPRGEPTALAKALARALAGDHPPLDDAAARAKKHFSVDAMVDGTLAVYGAVAARG